MEKQLAATERELRIRNYSKRTIDSYLYGLKHYFYFKKSEFERFNEENIKDFLFSCEQKGFSTQSRNAFLNAVKFYYREVVCVGHLIRIHAAKKKNRLPDVLSRDEIMH